MTREGIYVRKDALGYGRLTGPGELGHPGRFRSRREACAPRIGRSKNLFSRYRDRDVKLPIYASAGIPEAWLLDVSAERLEGHRHPTPDGYQDVSILQRGEWVAPQAFPDLVLTVDALLG